MMHNPPSVFRILGVRPCFFAKIACYVGRDAGDICKLSKEFKFITDDNAKSWGPACFEIMPKQWHPASLPSKNEFLGAVRVLAAWSGVEDEWDELGRPASWSQVCKP